MVMRNVLEGKLPGPHRETIIVMMRYGGSVDQIAQDLGIDENVLVKYIKDEELDKKLERRSWTWKRKNPRKRYRKVEFKNKINK